MSVKNRRNSMARRDKTNYYLDIAETVLERSTCLRLKYGAIIVRNDEIVSTGYNGAPRGRANCDELGTCVREKLNIPSGQRYELCRSVHAEANAIISAAREQTLGSTLFLACRSGRTGELVSGTTSCAMCKRLIINAGISQVIVRETKDDYTVYDVADWIEDDDTIFEL
jgi:dCMP deaminase